MLADQTNEEIFLTLMEDPRGRIPGILAMDVEYDSSLDPDTRVYGAFQVYSKESHDEEEFYFTLTMEEAYMMWDRLGRMLAISTDPDLEVDAG